ncbi:glycosyltransferase family 4 protein [Bacillus alkalisoli]|uniref:glycosyltransferase family 4 protein n=1 Tax=Bacillus alkalisoli TaxID=2011008 RepID=UPI001D0CF449|nr:glycosyltransferase family 4 protein [Bacillus alkalisoli]
MKKVLVLSNMYPSEKSKTFGIFVENQVKALKGRGLEVDVLAITNTNNSKGALIKKYFQWGLKTLWNVATKGKSYDVVHAHYVFPTGILGLLYKKFFNKRLIVTAHGGDIDRMSKTNPLILKWTNYILQESDHIIAVGQELKRAIHEDFQVPTEKISIINMGVNRDVFLPIEKKLARQQCQIGPDEIPLLFVGNLIEQKGILELLVAFDKVKKEIPNVSLYIIGTKKSNDFYEKITSISKDIGSVTIMDAKPQAEVAQWMSAAEAFILPSHLEGFGLVALEAMSCHTPVVGTNVGGLSYLLQGGAGVLVEAKNPESLFDGIIQLLNDKSNIASIVQEGENQADKNDERKMINHVLKLYGLSTQKDK